MAIEISYVRCANQRRYYFDFDDDLGTVVFTHADSDPEPETECTLVPTTEPYYVGTNFYVFLDTATTAHTEAIPGGSGGCTIADISATTVSDIGGAGGQIIGTGGVASGDTEWSLDGITWQNTSSFAPVYTGTYTLRAREKYQTDCVKTVSVFVPFVPNLAATISKTDSTAAGANDGSLLVTISNGSGNYQVQTDWEGNTNLSGANPQLFSRSSLPPDTYSLIVVDLVTLQTVTLSVLITEPTIIPDPDPDPEPEPDPDPVVEEGSVLRVPLLNSIHFIVEDNKMQGLDNTLLCDQVYKGFDHTNYFQPVLRSHTPIIQFESDFLNHTLQLHKYSDDSVAASYSVELKEENIGVVTDYAITIRNHTTVGQSRVYFATGLLPIPLSVGETFTIINNADGFNGAYSIVAIISDTLAGTQYLVINKEYLIGASSTAADGRFAVSNSDYNVYESQVNFVGLDDGKYYFKIVAESANQKIAISEPINIQAEHDGTFEIVYRNNDDGYGDITWSTGYTGKVLVPGHIGHKRLPGGDRSTSRNADFSLTKINAKKSRVIEVDMYTLPPYMIEKLSTIFDCDYFTLNGIECQTDDSLESAQLDRDLMANASIKVETKGWFKKYNSDDIGSVNEQGFITTEQGFIKR